MENLVNLYKFENYFSPIFAEFQKWFMKRTFGVISTSFPSITRVTQSCKELHLEQMTKWQQHHTPMWVCLTREWGDAEGGVEGVGHACRYHELTVQEAMKSFLQRNSDVSS